MFRLGQIIARLGIFIGGLGLLGSLFPLFQGDIENFLFGVVFSIGFALFCFGLRWVLTGRTIVID